MSGQRGTSGRTLPRAPRARGFTLIELMVVVAVVAILAAVAIPSYQDSVRKGRRGQAKTDLVEMAQLAERWRTVNNTYTGFTLPRTVSPAVGTAYYNMVLTITNGGLAFTARATPIVGTPQARDRCGALTINQAGARWHTQGTDDECGFGTTGTGP